MLECLILGDSIAVGTHYYNQIHGRTHCETHSMVGYNSYRWNFDHRNKTFKAKTVVISLGTNDRLINTKKEILSIRSRVTAERVYWVFPAINPDAQQSVKQVAFQYGDNIIVVKNLSKDKSHPNLEGYKQIVKIINETRIRQ